MSLDKVEFELEGVVDLRDPDEAEYKKIADRVVRLARDRYNAPLVVNVAVDPTTNEQSVQVYSAVEPVAETEEEITEDTAG